MIKKNKICFVIPSLLDRGPIKVVKSITDLMLTQTRFEFEVFYFDEVKSSKLHFNCKVEKINFSHKLKGFDIIHTHGLRPDLYGIYHYNNEESVYHISTAHNYIDELKFEYNFFISTVFYHVWKAIFRRVDYLVTLTVAMKKYYEKRGVKNICHIYNGILENKEQTPVQSNDHKLLTSFRDKFSTTIGSMCILTERKGIDQVLKLLTINKNLGFILIGDGLLLNNLKRMSNLLGVQEQVLFLGYKENSYKYLKYFDAFVIPSRSEGFGLTLIEAARYKTPVIASDIPTFRELFNKNEIAFFKPDDITDFNQKLKNIISNKQMYIDNAYKKYLNNYTDKIMANKYFELYEKAMFRY
ncbi:glycosyltransferase family 4 protein [Flammeovirga sp. OC4]|uniref:glycosyltransferase family 4 protein n=1 Tax=Flammeovirga sp. OC4 TaxID=1382345 RepID=UPI00155DD943|nr:glycosyltransferase family 4 protein [Flammeovirga sp. OC4]